MSKNLFLINDWQAVNKHAKNLHKKPCQSYGTSDYIGQRCYLY